jgi:hypothetical protein
MLPTVTHIANWKAWTARYLQDALVRFRPPDSVLVRGRPHIEAVVVDRFEMHARSYPIGDNAYRVELSYGTTELLVDFFQRSLATTQSFLGIGKPDCERFGHPTLGDLHTSVQVLSDDPALTPATRTITAVDPIRRTYGLHLTYLALDGIFLHELGHILKGHTDYLAAVASGRARKPTTAERKALEHEADTFSCREALLLADAAALGLRSINIDYASFFAAPSMPWRIARLAFTRLSCCGRSPFVVGKNSKYIRMCAVARFSYCARRMIGSVAGLGER